MQQYFINVPTITISIPKIVKTGTLCTCDIIVFDINSCITWSLFLNLNVVLRDSVFRREMTCACH